ncbi:NAD(P)H-binding protein [Phycicoccus sp. HDW14]|uniref:NAD(P)H-binding protein n=1 Tax=Phycicoccus sp. HDW14 TaxID=2714941 RepID=UPI001F10AC90|nr:NAD(P)H-binding protein [Phycicoccus sp. HDW14]
MSDTGHHSDGTGRRALVTGATGYIGSRLVPMLLDRGWTVRVLTRDASKISDRAWAGRAEVVEGDATSRSTLAEALADVDVAYYLLHSMDSAGGFVERDREMAQTFGRAAYEAEVGRIVYLSGLHPQEGPLSDHLASRVEVGDLLLSSGVPTAVLQAAIILGSGSASFEMLRHLTSRLPVMITPKWLDNRIQPIAARDVLHYLVGAADLPPTSTAPSTSAARTC